MTTIRRPETRRYRRHLQDTGSLARRARQRPPMAHDLGGDLRRDDPASSGQHQVSVSVVVPAHNEAAYLAGAVDRIVDALRDRPHPFEVIICENGSTDLTASVATELSRRHRDRVRVLSLPEPDYGRALRAGFLAASGDLVVNFDVDLVDLEFLDHAVAMAMDADRPDVVVGTKRGPGATDERTVGRRAVTAVFAAVLRSGFGLQVSDTHGLKLLRRRPLLPIVATCRFGADIFDTELILRAERGGHTVCEIPVRVAEQRPPRTPILRRIPRSLLGLARLRCSLWREWMSGRPVPYATTASLPLVDAS